MAKTLVSNFPHKIGRHCESSAMRDILEHAGIDLSEAMVFGLDATLGFAYFDKTDGSATFNFTNMPVFLGGKQGTITADSMACKILGCTIKMESFKNADDAWASSKGILSRDTPLGIQVDMGYLPYFKEQFHFGGHVISLVGLDDEKDVALVYERDLLDVQEVPISALQQARGSKVGDKFMHPNHRQFTITRRADGKKPPFARAVKLALQKVATNMIACSMNFQGLPGLKLAARHIPQWKEILQGDIIIDGSKTPVPAAPATLQLLHGFIEEYGTGGGLFRYLYADFLSELANHDEILHGPLAWTADERELLDGARDAIRASGSRWSAMASCIKEAIEAGKDRCLDTLDTD
nr:BtrH N-terminal domain-containing protein [Candidatus Sigynarchaeota archaeon]